MASARTAAETPVFPHYSLMEGHDRFERLPAADARAFKPLHRDNCGFPSPDGAVPSDGRAPLVRRVATAKCVGAQPKRYCVEKEATSLPTFSLPGHRSTACGQASGIRLAVNELHAFVAGTVAVHNCIGNSGPLRPEISAAVKPGDLIGCAVLSGNRNFEGRVHPGSANEFPGLSATGGGLRARGHARHRSRRGSRSARTRGQAGLSCGHLAGAEGSGGMSSAMDSEMFRRSYAACSTAMSAGRASKYPRGSSTLGRESTYVKNPPYFEA